MSQQSTGPSHEERATTGQKKPRRVHQLQIAAASQDPESLMDMPLIGVFFGGKSLMTISRWRKHADPDRRFPAPDLHIGATPYWTRRSVIAYRDRLAALSSAQNPLTQNTPTDSAGNAQAAPAPASGGTRVGTSAPVRG